MFHFSDRLESWCDVSLETDDILKESEANFYVYSKPRNIKTKDSRPTEFCEFLFLENKCDEFKPLHLSTTLIVRSHLKVVDGNEAETNCVKFYDAETDCSKFYDAESDWPHNCYEPETKENFSLGHSKVNGIESSISKMPRFRNKKSSSKNRSEKKSNASRSEKGKFDKGSGNDTNIDSRTKDTETDHLKESQIDSCSIKEHLPYSFNDITSFLAHHAEIEFKENDEIKAKSLKGLKDLLKEDTNLNFKDDDQFLLSFLRPRNFRIKGAAYAIKRYYSHLNTHRNLYDRNDMKTLSLVVLSNIFGFLPYRDSSGRAIVYGRAAGWDPDELPSNEGLYGALVSMKGSLRKNLLNQVIGVIGVVDLAGVSFKQFYSAMTSLFHSLQALMTCCNCDVHALHVIHFSSMFRIAWRMVQPILPAKIKEKIIFHSDMKSFHQQVPASILPVEFGGELGPISNLHWAEDLEVLMSEHCDEMKYGYTRKEAETK